MNSALLSDQILGIIRNSFISHFFITVKMYFLLFALWNITKYLFFLHTGVTFLVLCAKKILLNRVAPICQISLNWVFLFSKKLVTPEIIVKSRIIVKLEIVKSRIQSSGSEWLFPDWSFGLVHQPLGWISDALKCWPRPDRHRLGEVVEH